MTTITSLKNIISNHGSCVHTKHHLGSVNSCFSTEPFCEGWGFITVRQQHFLTYNSELIQAVIVIVAPLLSHAVH